MKKFILALLLILTACSSREGYYELSIDDYSVMVGYDDAEYIDIAFDYDLKDTLQPYETVSDVDIYLFDQLLGVGEFTNNTKKEIDSNKAILTKLTVYLNDVPGRQFRINKEILNTSVKNNCEKYSGTYIEKNGYACVIQTQNKNDLNVIELYGDYLNLDQDQLDHLSIYVK